MGAEEVVTARTFIKLDTLGTKNRNSNSSRRKITKKTEPKVQRVTIMVEKPQSVCTQVQQMFKSVKDGSLVSEVTNDGVVKFMKAK